MVRCQFPIASSQFATAHAIESQLAITNYSLPGSQIYISPQVSERGELSNYQSCNYLLPITYYRPQCVPHVTEKGYSREFRIQVKSVTAFPAHKRKIQRKCNTYLYFPKQSCTDEFSRRQFYFSSKSPWFLGLGRNLQWR